MPLRMIVFFAFITFLVFLVDLYGYKGIRMLTENLDPLWRKITRFAWWLPSIIWLGLAVYLFLNFTSIMAEKSYKFFYFVGGFGITFFVSKMVFLGFHFIEDLIQVGRWAVSKVYPSGGADDFTPAKITRLQFLSQTGLILSGVVFGSMVYGQIQGKYDFKVFREKLRFPKLPTGLRGMKIVQLSDMHLGSFLDNSFEEVKGAIAKVNELEPDYIFFTGDMVNNFAYETDAWIEIIGGLKAKKGKYSILGNHDYGDYVPWETEEEKSKNLEDLYLAHQRMGFTLLRNENIVIQHKESSFNLIGVENWGQGFHQYGDLDKAMAGINSEDFNILLSHDPTHWEKKVMDTAPIELTLSGHTHGMQLGVEIPSLGIKISPARLRYKRWAGLYENEGRFLYVNRGFGYLGFPGRVGIKPEITLLEFDSELA